MIVAAGHWETGYNLPLIESHQWRFPLSEFQIDQWAMCPVYGVKPNDPKVKLTEYNDYEEIISAYPNLTRVFIEPRTKNHPDTIWLHDFDHPDDVIYIFGSAHFDPVLKHKRDQDFVVSIKTKTDTGCLWPAGCLSILLYDKMIKEWQ